MTHANVNVNVNASANVNVSLDFSSPENNTWIEQEKRIE